MTIPRYVRGMTHTRDCGCTTCRRLKGRTIETDAWRKQHRLHLGGAGLGFMTKDFPHPSGEWVWLVCPCGAKHLTTREAS